MQGVPDVDLLSKAFDRKYSLRNSQKYGYDVHGLHTIDNLIRLYDGYLLVQSGRGMIESDANGQCCTLIKEADRLPGTLFEVLIPFDPPQKRNRFVQLNTGKHNRAKPSAEFVFLIQELRRTVHRLPPSDESECDSAIGNVVARLSTISGALYIDLSGMPRERHFLCRVLSAVRKSRLHCGPTVLTNAASDVFAAISSLVHIDSDIDLLEMDLGLSQIMVRGKEEAVQPLVIPVITISENSRSARIQWIGLSALKEPRRGLLIDALTFLFNDGGGHSVETLLANSRDTTNVDVVILDRMLRSLQRANPELLYYDAPREAWSLALNAAEVLFDSEISLTSALSEEVAAKALLPKTNPNTVYCLGWRKGSSARDKSDETPKDDGNPYIKDFYSVWNVVKHPKLATFAAISLLRKAHRLENVAKHFSNLGGLVSATPSAGLIARELSRILRIPHFEVSSIYELENVDWPITFDDHHLFVVDDLIDSGTVSERLIQRVESHAGNVDAVLAFLESKEGAAQRSLLNLPVVSLIEVSLQRAMMEEVKNAEQEDVLFDIDPYTLEPLPKVKRIAADINWIGSRNARWQSIMELASSNALRNGHYAYSGHHYQIVFDLVTLISNPSLLAQLTDWFWDSINDWVSSVSMNWDLADDEHISIIYPYFSPICAFLHEMSPLAKSRCQRSIEFHVAKPVKKSQGKTGYTLGRLASPANPALSRLMVFVDDGVATGGTLAAIVDEVVGFCARREQATECSFLALIIFDRIGVSPRKHLRSIDRYKGAVSFSYKPKYEFNLQSYFKDTCPDCRIHEIIEKLLIQTRPSYLKPFGGEFEFLAGQIRPRTIKTISSPLGSTEVDSLLSPKEVADMLLARDAIFSDKPSPEEISTSVLKGNKSAKSKLEIIYTVLADSHLSRVFQADQALSKTFLVDELCRVLCSASLDMTYASWFILRLTTIPDGTLARRLVWFAIPNYLQKVGGFTLGGNSVADRLGAKVETSSIRCVFDKHPELVCSLLTAMYLLPRPGRNPSSYQSFSTSFPECELHFDKYASAFDNYESADGEDVYDNENSPEFPREWAEEWCRATRDTPYLFLFAGPLGDTDEQSGLRDAKMLLCNFVAGFREHEESYYWQLYSLVARSISLADDKRFARHKMDHICSAIENVQRFYRVPDTLFPVATLKAIKSYHKIWLDEDDQQDSEFLSIVSESLVHPMQIFQNETNLGRFLGAISGNVTEIEREVRQRLGRDIRVDWDLETFPIRAHFVANRAKLVEAICEIITNTQKYTAGPPCELGIMCQIMTAATSRVPTESRLAKVLKLGQYVAISVISPGSFSQPDIDSWFGKGGGLMINREMLRSFGGDLLGEPYGTGSTALHVLVPSINIGGIE